MTMKSYDAWTHHFGHGFGDRVSSATDVDVSNLAEIDIENDVAAAQETFVSADIGHGSSAIIDESMNAAPQQSGAVGNFDGAVATGQVAVDAGTESFGGGWFDFGGDRLSSMTDVDVANVTAISLDNDVTAIQNTAIDLDVGPHSSAIISESLNAAPSQNLAVGNFGGEVQTGAVEIQVDDFLA